MSLAIIIGIIVLGILLVLVEVFLIPGSTFVGLVGAVIVGLGVYFTFSHLGAQAGFITLIISSVVLLVLFYVGFKNLKRVSITETIDSQVNILEDDTILVGDVGKAFTDCKPAGKAIFDGKKINVISTGEFIMKGHQVQVVKLGEGKVFVKEITLGEKI